METTTQLNLKEIMLQAKSNLLMPSQASQYLNVQRVKNNFPLLNFLGTDFIAASYIQASINSANYAYVTWQLERNAPSVKLIGTVGPRILLQSGDSKRYYLINTKLNEVLAIQK